VKVDWKSYYRRELVDPKNKAMLEGFFATDEHLAELIGEGALISFPHTALSYVGPLQARVVTGLYRAGVSRVIALGVLHTSVLPAPYLEYLNRLNDPSGAPEERKAAFSQLAGAFFPPGKKVTTPFGDLPLIPGSPARLIREDTGILENEFSLDTFFSLLSFYAARRRVKPIPVLPLYVGLTYDPVNGSFSVADALAHAIQEGRTPGTAVVTTGDLVHYGTAYSDPERIAKMPKEKETLEAYFLPEVKKVIALGLAGDLKAAFERSRETLASDQRYILPVISYLLGPGTGFEILHFELSDYAGILSVGPPCYVASSLIAFIPR